MNLYITTTTNNNKKKMKTYTYPYKPIKKYYETDEFINLQFYLSMILVVFVLLNVINM